MTNTSSTSYTSEIFSDLKFSPDYRQLLWDYAMSVRKYDRRGATQSMRLLRDVPCLVGPDPYPERRALSEGRTHKVIPWWKLNRHKNIGKGKVKYDG